ncbi:MAG: lysophospholipid acyltransferase family protein [Myxococcota bacterium]|nr:lysophospholipid acyltransferase family protein [Myxococcota bacterium]
MTWRNMLLVPFVGSVAVAWSTLCLLPILPLALIPRFKREPYTFWASRLASWGMLRLALLGRPHLEGLDKLPVGEPYLLISNHRSFVDVLLLIWAGQTHGISKSGVKWFPVMGYLGYLGGAVFFDRDSPESRRKGKEDTIRMIRQGRAMHVYPEGTRTRTGPIREKTYPGLVKAAYEAGIQVVPASCWGTDLIIPPTNKGVRLFQDCWMRIGEPVQPSDFPDDFDAFFDAAWSQVKGMTAELREAHPHAEVDLLKE